MSPEGYEGDVKLLHPVTMENIAAAAIAENLATEDEVREIVAELYAIARDATTLLGLPRVVQAVGYRTERAS